MKKLIIISRNKINFISKRFHKPFFPLKIWIKPPIALSLLTSHGAEIKVCKNIESDAMARGIFLALHNEYRKIHGNSAQSRPSLSIFLLKHSPSDGIPWE